MISRIFLFRHGQTDWNKEGRFQGHTDIPLNQTGVAEAEELRPYVEKLKPEMMISSDLLRAQMTANIVNSSMNLNIDISAKLRETNLGEAEGLLHYEVDQVFGVKAMASWASNERETINFGFPGGESKLQVVTRVLSHLESIVIKQSVVKLAVSTHGGVIKRICHYIANIPAENVPIKNCCLYELEFSHSSGEWRFIVQHK